MKVYLDNCCYNRPFDDQTQEILTRKLGAVDSVRFLRQFEDGSGDYTQERVQDNTIDEIAENIYKRKHH